MNNDIEKYISEFHRERINIHKNKATEIINSIPKHYKNKDYVYFKKHYKTIPSKIVCQKYRSAKKYKDLYFLFPTQQLAIEYYYIFQQESFATMSNVLDEVIPKVYQENIVQFTEVKDINVGESYINQVSFDDFNIGLEINREHKNSLKCPQIKL